MSSSSSNNNHLNTNHLPFHTTGPSLSIYDQQIPTPLINGGNSMPTFYSSHRNQIYGSGGVEPHHFQLPSAPIAQPPHHYSLLPFPPSLVEIQQQPQDIRFWWCVFNQNTHQYPTMNMGYSFPHGPLQDSGVQDQGGLYGLNLQAIKSTLGPNIGSGAYPVTSQRGSFSINQAPTHQPHQHYSGYRFIPIPPRQVEAEGDLQMFVQPEPSVFPMTKPRLRWTPPLHRRFMNAVRDLGGLFKATPKNIMERMNVRGLSVDNLKSHLQKMRCKFPNDIPDFAEGDQLYDWVALDPNNEIEGEGSAGGGEAEHGQEENEGMEDID